MAAPARIVNLLISLVVAWLAYTREITINQITSLLQKISQISPDYALLLEGIILLANFVLAFLLLSVLFEAFESKD